MTQTQLTPEVQALWEKLERFQLDQDNAVLDFSARLARENGWARAYTARVVQEYKRFILLAIHAGHPVTPSEAVDQAWHLHLVYTRSYWHQLCGQVLGQPLHHQPTVGGAGESARFQAQYQHTLESYQRLFAESPPADIWPPVQERFRPQASRWVDLSQHWLLPKPRVPRALRLRYVLPTALAVFLCGGLAGCQGAAVLDYRGSEFLTLFVQLFVAACLVSWLIVKAASSAATSSASAEPPTDPYEIAFLGGGGRRVVDAALAVLFSRGLLSVVASPNSPAKLGLRPEAKVADLHPIEQQVLTALPANGSHVPLRTLRQSLRPVTEALQERLVLRGWLFSYSRYVATAWLAAAPLLLVVALGLLKIAIGITRDKPVIYLFFLVLAATVITLVWLTRLPRRTRAGGVIWAQLRSTLKARTLLSVSLVDPAPVVALAVAYYGTAALSRADYKPLYNTLNPLGSSVSSDSGGCGTGGCSTGGGGDGGCGGGCGGCGGCGGD